MVRVLQDDGEVAIADCGGVVECFLWWWWWWCKGVGCCRWDEGYSFSFYTGAEDSLVLKGDEVFLFVDGLVHGLGGG